MRAFLLILLLLCACSHSAQIKKESDAANVKYDQMKEEIVKPYEEGMAKVEEYRTFLIPTAEGGVCPASRVDQREFVGTYRTECLRLQKQAGEVRNKQLKEKLKATEDQCWGLLKQAYLQQVGLMYFKTDWQWTADRLKENPQLDLECVATYSHNQAVLAHIEERRRQWRYLRDSSAARVEEQRHAELDQIANKNRGPSGWAILGAALQGMGQGLSNSASSSTKASSVKGCSSDYDCGMGFKCVKPYYSTSGSCMTAVDKYGAQSFDLPRLDSYKTNTPSSNDCTHQGCPAGFTCDYNSGTCTR